MVSAVTDPNILAQLNAKPVSDPNILAQLNSAKPDISALPSSKDGLGSIGRGFLQGATLGGADEIMAKLGQLYAQARGVNDVSGVDLYNQALTSQRNKLKTDYEQNPVSSIAGNVLGGIPSTIAGMGLLGKVAPSTTNYLTTANSFWGARGKDVLQGIMYGAPTGFLSGEGDNRIDTAIGGGILGGAISPVLGAASAGVGGILSPRKSIPLSSTSPEVQTQLQPEIASLQGQIPNFNYSMEGTNLASPIRMSKGDITQNFGTQDIEEQMLKGVRGEKAQSIMSDFRTQQSNDFMNNLQSMYSGGKPTENIYLGDVLGKNIQKAGKVAQRAKNIAYQAAEREGDKAILPVEFAPQLAERIKVSVSGYDPEIIPQVRQINKYADELVALASKPEVSGLKYNTLEGLRKRFNALPTGNDAATMGAIGEAKKGFDGFMDDIFKQGVMQGDDKALALINRARKANSYYKEKFTGKNANNVIKNYIKENGENLAPENLLDTFTRVGQTGINNVKAAKDILGEQALPILRDGYLNKITNNSLFPDGTVSPLKLQKNIDDFFNKNPSLVKEVFNDKEVASLKELSALAKRTRKQEGIQNFSNSTNLLARLAQDNSFIGNLIRKLPFGNTAMTAVKDITAGQQAAKLVSPAIETPYRTLGSSVQEIGNIPLKINIRNNPNGKIPPAFR